MMKTEFFLMKTLRAPLLVIFEAVHSKQKSSHKHKNATDHEKKVSRAVVGSSRSFHKQE